MIGVADAKRLVRVALPVLYEARSAYLAQRQRVRVAAVLRQGGSFEVFDDEAVFSMLQARYRPLPNYGYDCFSTWARGTRRALGLLERERLRQSELKVLEAACGDGMTGWALGQYGHEAHLCDLKDWRDPRASGLPFEQADWCDRLPYEDSSFDLAISYNAFEHLREPGRALSELIRVLKPGGLIYLEFGPLYASPRGLHAYRTLLMPFPQYIFSEEFTARKLRDLGISDLGESKSELQYLNRWSVRQFRDLWDTPRCTLLEAGSIPTEPTFLDVVEEFPGAFIGRALTLEDLMTQGLWVWLQKAAVIGD